MIPYKQLIKHDPDKGQYGDCFRACIASILNYPMIEAVPHFCEDGADSEIMFQRCDAFLSRHDLRFVEIPFVTKSLEEMLKSCAFLNGTNHYILLGQSKLGVNHNVVCLGDRIVHDPSGNGIVGPADDGQYWMGLLAKRTP